MDGRTRRAFLAADAGSAGVRHGLPPFMMPSTDPSTNLALRRAAWKAYQRGAIHLSALGADRSCAERPAWKEYQDGLGKNLYLLERLYSCSDKPWYWEGNVQGELGFWLLGMEWTVLHVSDTRARGRGPDLLARRDRRLLTVEVKGWPQSQRSHPCSVAGANWARAFDKAVQIRVAKPDTDVAIALPAMEFVVG